MSAVLVILLSGFLSFGFSKVSVEIQWEDIPDAKSYELEIQDRSGKVITTVKSKSALFEFKIQPGQFQARCRAKDAREVPGDWSELTPLEVEPPKPKLLSANSAGTKNSAPLLLPEGATETAHELLWKPVDGAENYEIELRDASGKITTAKSTSDRVSVLLSSGSYQYRVRALSRDHQSAFTDWSKNLVVEAPPLQAPEVLDLESEPAELGSPLVIKTKPGKQGAELIVESERRAHLSAQWEPVKTYVVKGSEVSTADWAPGEYRVHMYYKKSGFPDSHRQLRELVIKPRDL